MISSSRQLKDKVRICNIPLEDNVRFQIKSTRTIMEEFDYPGIRVMLEATLHLISDDLQMEELWAQFQKSNFYVGDLAWKNVIGYVENTMKKYLL